VAWPPLPLAEWKDTYHALHMWTQMAGKLQLGLTPLTNHWRNVTLQVTARGLTTRPMPIGPDVRSRWRGSTSDSWVSCASWASRPGSGRCRWRCRIPSASTAP
jgi:hypothetical protein